MSIEVISENITGPWWADAGDTVRVLEGVLVDGTDTQGIAPRAATDTGIRVVVHGTVIGEYYGVNLEGNPEGVSGNRLFVSETGSVTGLAPVYAGDGSGNRVVNKGVIDGRFGIVGDGAETVIVNHGTIRAEYSSLILDGGAITVRNHGLIEAGGGTYFEPGTGSRFVNTGTIETQAGGLYLLGGSDFELINRGLIRDHHQDGGYGATVEDTDGFFVSNSGTMEAQHALSLVDSAGFVRNTGTLLGSSSGIQIIGGELHEVHIRNTGLIAGTNTGLNSASANLHLRNSGVIEGGVLIEEGGRVQISNSGRVIGDIDLAGTDDFYFARGTGHVTGDVNGGSGEDILTGAAADDRLFGGWGNDILSGRDGDDHLDGGFQNDEIHGGNGRDTLLGGDGQDSLNGGWGGDVLDGGTGNDLLTGAQGRDHLTGGAGADIFVFGADAGEDRITDFEQGTDVIRLEAHTGGFAALTLSDRNAHLEIIHDGGVIVLEHLAGHSLAPSDFDIL